MKRFTWLLPALLACITVAAGEPVRDHSRRIVFEKYLWAEGVNPQARYLDQLIVKFFDEDSVRLRDGRLVSLNGRTALDAARDFLARHPDIRPQVIITNKTEEQYTANLRRIEQQSGWDLVDLFSFYLLRLPEPAADPKALLADILKAPEVETAYYQPIGYDALCQDLGSATPNFIPNQTYHDPAPLGTDLDYARTAYGADLVDGVSGTWVGIFERGMQVTHEDFSSAEVRTAGTPATDNDHGTAVTGIMGGCDDNSVGVLGYLADEALKLYQRNSSSYPTVADVYNFANGELLPGEVTTNSWQMLADPMPPGQSCPCNAPQNGYVCIEYDAALKAEIEAGVAEGIHYFLSAGNGCVNLDHAVFGNTFRYTTDTGSNYVGAVKSTLPHDSSCFTNWGERVDLCAWGNGIYSTGYGTAFAGTGRDEWYDNDFGGTSGAGPIVAGCAGVVNNIYRSMHDGANVSTSFMRDLLRVHGTGAGTFPGTDDPEMPNLFGIAAPDLETYTLTGWSDCVVPRNSGDATSSWAPLPPTLVSEPDTTFFNSAMFNSGYLGGAAAAYWELYRDDDWLAGYIVADGMLDPQTAVAYANHERYIRGGRHTIRLECDPNNEVVEFDEEDNRRVQQFVWNPRPLTSEAPLTFTQPPQRIVTGHAGIPYNVDGYSLAAEFGGYWDVFAVVSETAESDYDARVYSEAISSADGFDDYEVWSAQINGVIDIVGKNNNVVAGTALVSVLNWDAGTDDYRVEGEGSDYLGTPGYGRNSMGERGIQTSEILEVFEFRVDELVSYTIEVDVTAGLADVVISVFGPDDDYFALSGRNASSNTAGSGGDELLCFTPAQTGYYAAVIHKYSSADYARSAVFNLYIGKSLFDLTPNLNPGWSHEVVVRQVEDGQPVVLPPALTGGVATNYVSVGLLNRGCVASPFGLSTGFYRDGPLVHTATNMVSWPAGATGWLIDMGPIPVFHGRHNIGAVIDPANEAAEWIETNNRSDEQFVWVPQSISNQMAYVSTDPAPNYRNSESSVFFAAPNCDGWRFTGSAYWSGVAVAPIDPDDDYNVAIYEPSTGSENGFDMDYVLSAALANGIIEFALANGNLNGSHTYDAGVRNLHPWPNDPSDGPYLIYQCNRIQDLQNNALNGPFPMTPVQPFHVFDLHLTAGDTTRFILDNLGAVDLGLAIFDADDAYGSRTDYGTIRNWEGDGADENISFVPTTTGWHGIVVFKHDRSDMLATQYRLIIGDRTPAAPTGLVMEVLNNMSSPILTRMAWNAVTTDNLGAPITVDHYDLYYTTDDINAFPTGWILFGSRPDTGPVNVSISVTLPYVRFAVTAVDADGFVVGGVGLPAGFDPTGLHESDLPGSSATLDVRMVPAAAGTDTPARE